MEKEILNILYQIVNEREPSKEYKEMSKHYSQEKEEFIKKIGENNRADLDKLTETIYSMDNVLGFEDFCLGFSMGIQLFIECIYGIKRDDQE